MYSSLCHRGASAVIPRHAGGRSTAPPPVGEHEAAAVADLFRTLADPTRLRILALLTEDEACVHVICARLGMGQSAVSHQLRLLRGMRLVRARKSGRLVFYVLDDHHILDLFGQGRRHAEEDAPVSPRGGTAAREGER